jgi:hypothetical protein
MLIAALPGRHCLAEQLQMQLASRSAIVQDMYMQEQSIQVNAVGSILPWKLNGNTFGRLLLTSPKDCGNSLAASATLSPDGDCNMGCAGNR